MSGCGSFRVVRERERLWEAVRLFFQTSKITCKLQTMNNIREALRPRDQTYSCGCRFQRFESGRSGQDMLPIMKNEWTLCSIHETSTNVK